MKSVYEFDPNPPRGHVWYLIRGRLVAVKPNPRRLSILVATTNEARIVGRTERPR